MDANQPEKIARRAIELATSHIKTDRKDLADMAAGDPNLLREAARIVQQQPQDMTSAAMSAEHLAYNLITAAYELLSRKPQA